ncbi:Plastidal glycolate/glycerate translocator 1, chloroplastic [Rhypophila sp. PSN 637]
MLHLPRSTPGRGSFVEVATDVLLSLKLAFSLSRHSLLRSWVQIPFGITLMLLASFAVDVLLKHAHVSFPASVACLIFLFFGLLLSELVLGNHRTKVLTKNLDVPAGWSLRWISVFFTPTFVLLPLSPPIGGVEVVKIIAVFAYLTRSLQLLTGSSKRHSHTPQDPQGQPVPDLTVRSPPEYHPAPPWTPLRCHNHSTTDHLTSVTAPSSTWAKHLRIRFFQTSVYRQIPLPPPRSQIWATYIAAKLDWFVHGAVGLLIGLPVYYATGYAMPLHLSVTILSFYIALTLPQSWKRFLHTVLVSAFLTVMTLWIIGLTRNKSLNDTLHEYRTGLTYLQLWEGSRTTITQKSSGISIRPGAGDILATILDASIVSLALPMYNYRRELKQHFTSIVMPNIILSIGSLFAYPVLCFAIGISAERSLAFAARILTLALARPAMDNLGGDVNTISAVAIMSGIIGALVGGRMLDLMRIPEDDYVTRGVTLGTNSSAIATALLLQTDPRAAALSSLSMSLFGTITVLFTAIPAIRDVVRSMVGI